MTKFRRMLREGLAATATLLGKTGLRRLLLGRALPPRQETLKLAGLRDQVEVLFDRWGVPHIQARHLADVFFAQGYCHARDRFWQMELNRRLARGELAAMFGERLLQVDRFVRRLGFLRCAEAEAATVSAEVRTLAEAYTAGVNAYLERHRRPVEFMLLGLRPQPWRPVDSLAFGRFMGWSLTYNWESELIRARLIAQLGPERAAALEPGDPAGAIPWDLGPQSRDSLAVARDVQPLAGLVGGGSNSWVVAAARSTSGRALLANDPHFRPRIPAVWYVAHLSGAGLDVIGATLPGTLGVLIGHNARVAWGITASMIDGQDLYVERADPARPRRFAFRDGWEDAQVIREEIRIRGREAPFIEEVVLTRHGPLLNGTVGIPPAGTPLAGKGTTELCTSPTEALLRLNKAADWPTFRAALADWTFPVLNFVYADVDGNIGYKLAGRVPLRTGGDGYAPVPGWDGEHEWQGYVPFDELPEAFNPPDGLFATANTRPAAPCRHFLSRDWVDASRWVRIMDLLRQQPRHSLEEAQAMQTDVTSVPAQEVARLLVASAAAWAPTEAALQPLRVRALGYLANWKGEMGPQSVPAAIYSVFRREYVRRRHRDLPAPLLAYVLGQGVDEVLAGVSTFHHRAAGYLLGYLQEPANPQEIGEAFDTALGELRRLLGPDPVNWQWGRLHQILFAHPIGLGAPLLDRFLGLSQGPVPIGGDADTIAQSGSDPWHPYMASTFTVSYRQLFEAGDWDKGLFILPTGQSGHPGSPHYADMLEAWRRGEYRPLLFTRAAVEREVTETIHLGPG